MHRDEPLSGNHRTARNNLLDWLTVEKRAPTPRAPASPAWVDGFRIYLAGIGLSRRTIKFYTEPSRAPTIVSLAATAASKPFPESFNELASLREELRQEHLPFRPRVLVDISSLAVTMNLSTGVRPRMIQVLSIGASGSIFWLISK